MSKKSPMVLIVDDTINNIQVVASFLKPEGYRLAFAQDGKAALTQAEKQSIDLILLDVMMPEMDGFEVCTRLKASPQTQNIPVIFLTGKTETENVVHGLEVGAVDYVTKPFNREELLARVRAHLELKQAKEHIQKVNAQMEEELDIASDIQQSIMREKPLVPFLSSSMSLNPYGKVSGDMIDLSTKNDEFRVFIGDATGHGVPAALLTMMVPFILDGIGEQETSLEAIHKINISLAIRNLNGRFITGIYIKVNKTGLLSACNAGHPPLIIAPKDGSPLILFQPSGMALGIFSPDEYKINYQEEKYQLHPGDKFFLYTDGIIEWQNPKQELFGEERLNEIIEQNRTISTGEIFNKLMEQIDLFRGDVPCGDDYTFLGFEYLG